jgi:hypothetical protein
VVHALCLAARADSRSRWCDDVLLQSLLLSMVPPALQVQISKQSWSATQRTGGATREVQLVTALLSWLRETVQLDAEAAFRVSCSSRPGKIAQCGVRQLQRCVHNKQAGKEQITLLFVACARALGMRQQHFHTSALRHLHPLTPTYTTTHTHTHTHTSRVQACRRGW